PWTVEATERVVRAFAERRGIKLGGVAQPLRAALTGRTTSPPIFDVLAVLGKSESLGRLHDQISGGTRPAAGGAGRAPRNDKKSHAAVVGQPCGAHGMLGHLAAHTWMG